MDKYAYQIQGALENAQGTFLGLRVLVCSAYYFDSVDVPAEVLDRETAKYIEFRLMLTESMDIQRLPYSVQNKIRTPLGRYLDDWVRKNYGNTGKRKDSNPGLLETGQPDPTK